MLIWKRSWNNPATSQLTTFECMLDAHIIHINVHSLANLANYVTCNYITYYLNYNVDSFGVFRLTFILL